MVDLGIPPELTPEQQSIENIKKSIRIIEGVFHAINQPGVTFPLRVSEQMLEGMSFLNQMHTQLIQQLPAEELEKMRNQHKSVATPPPPALVKSDGTTPAA